MSTQKRKVGAKKGVPKPPRRRLDPGFGARLAELMGNDWTNATLGDQIGCERQTIHNMVNGQKTTFDVLLLFPMAEALNCSAKWLLTGEGPKRVPPPLNDDQTATLAIYAALQNIGKVSAWFDYARFLQGVQSAPAPAKV